MIVETMTWKEMFDTISADCKKIEFRMEKMRPKAARTLQQKRVFPAWFIDEYTIPANKNKYILFYYAETTNDAGHPFCQCFSIVEFGKNRYILVPRESAYKHTPKSELIILPQLHVYTNHFLERYNERCLHFDKLTLKEIAGLFLVRNREITPIELNEQINKNYKDHGINNQFGIDVKDGFCFVLSACDIEESKDGIPEHDIAESMLVLYTTFISKYQLKKEQEDAIIQQELKMILEYYDQFPLNRVNF